jgi:hypothetical protein
MNYVNTIRDPFEYAGVRIGFGTMVPTGLYTAYFRGVFQCSTDGTFCLYQQPSLGNANPNMYYSNSTASVAAWNALNYTNSASIAGLASEARVVSGGIRVIPQVPATAAPGIGYCGSIPACWLNTITPSSANALASSPHLVMGRAAEGACAVIRPVDPASYQFLVNNINGYPNANTASSSCPIIILTGLPASSTIVIEAILNLETISTWTSVAQAITNPELVSNQPTLADRFSNVESLFRAAAQYIPTSGTINTAASLMNAIGSVSRRVSRIVAPRSALSSYGSGMPRMRIEEVD